MRKRLTQLLPWLTPIRTTQAKTCFYLRSISDKRFHLKKQSKLLQHQIYTYTLTMINTETGFPIEYQYNKAFNLQLLAQQFNSIIIKPGQILSFNYLARNADRYTPYKDGLILVNDDIVIGYGGGLCQLSNMLYYVALHTPLTITKRNGHTSQHLYDPNATLFGIDATVSYGFSDLQIKNTTNDYYQICIEFPTSTTISVSIRSDVEYNEEVVITNSNLKVYEENKHVYQSVDVNKTIKTSDKTITTKLYTNVCELAYKTKMKGQ